MSDKTGIEMTDQEYARHYDCPKCGQDLPCISIRKTDFAVCDDCRLYYWVSTNLSSAWMDETEENWKKRYEHIQDYELVKSDDKGGAA